MKNKQTTLILSVFLSITTFAWANPSEVDHAKIDAGKKIFMATCFACHGPDGKGLVPGTPNLTDEKSPLLQESAVLIGKILEGFQSKGSPMAMPPKGGNPKLTDKDVADVVVFMKSTFLKTS